MFKSMSEDALITVMFTRHNLLGLLSNTRPNMFLNGRWFHWGLYPEPYLCKGDMMTTRLHCDGFSQCKPGLDTIV